MKFIFLSLAIGLLCTIDSKAQFSGCANLETGPINRQVTIVKSTGNPQMDRWLDWEGSVLRSFFGVNAGLIMYDDSLVNRPNTFFSTAPESGDHYGGTVAIGINYLQNMYNYSGSFSMTPIVASHQFAHILDLTLKVTPPIHIYKELYADYMAGCFMAYSSKQTWADISHNLRWIVRVGDYTAINDPAYHGTPMQRMAAFKSGYDWFKSQALAGKKVVALDASNAAKQYLNVSDDRMAANE